jgi:hypothetical protein
MAGRKVSWLGCVLFCAVVVWTGSEFGTKTAEASIDEVEGAQSPPSTAATPQLIWLRLVFPSVPSPRQGFSITLNTDNQEAMIFGGQDPLRSYDNDLWLTNGFTWQPVGALFTPVGRVGSSMAYDQANHMAVIFGGSSNYEFLGNTWTYDGHDFLEQLPESSPLPRASASMAYDAARKQVILFGGNTFAGYNDPNHLDDTWAWDGKNWRQLFPVNHPPARAEATMVYDPIHQEIVLFGGARIASLFGDTWVWDGTNWIEQHPVHNPPVNTDVGMAYDETRKLVILAGGQSLANNETWAWDGQDWTQLQTRIDPPMSLRFSAKLAYLPGLQTVVMMNDDSEKLRDNTSFDEFQVWKLTNGCLNYLPIVSQAVIIG